MKWVEGGGLHNKELFLTVLEAGELEIMVRVLMKALFLIYRWSFSSCILPWPNGERASL